MQNLNPAQQQIVKFFQEKAIAYKKTLDEKNTEI